MPMPLRIRARWLGLAGGILLFCTGTLAEAAEAVPFPALPKLSLAKFSPPIRRQLSEAYERVRLNPREAAANGRLGNLLHAYDQLESAVVCYQRARSLKPGEFKWAYYLAMVHAGLGKQEEAVTLLEQSMKLMPDYLPAQLQLAESLLALGKWTEGEKIYERIVQEHPGCAQAHYGLGRIKAARGELAAAAEHYRKACDLFANFGAAHYALGLAYRDLGETARAQQHLSLYQKDKLGWPVTEDPLLAAIHELRAGANHYLKKGVSLEAGGQVEAAAAEHEKALEIDPQYVQARVNLITLYGRLGQPEKAEKHYRSAIAINPNLAEGHYNFGVLLTGQEKFSEAAAAFRRALEINPFYAEAHNNLAYLLMNQGNLEEAVQHYRAAIQNRPNYRLAHFNLGRILVHQKRIDEAIEHFLQTLTPEDDSTPGFVYALAAAYARGGDRKSALHRMREARERAAALGQTELLASIEKDLRILEQGSSPP